MDGDHSAKTMDAGANKAISSQDFTESVHESAHQAEAAGEKATGHGGSVLDKTGAIGKQFTGKWAARGAVCFLTLNLYIAEGAIGGTAQKIGGPFDKEGSIGKQFNPDGSLGGTAQRLADQNQQH